MGKTLSETLDGRIGRPDGRIKLISFVFALFFLFIIARLFFWQVVRNDSLVQLGRSQFIKGEETKAKRGAIFASDGQVLVATKTAWSMWAEPQKFATSPQDLATIIARTISPHEDEASISAQLEGEEKTRIYNLITKTGAKWVLLREKISDEQKNEIEKYGFSGVGFSEDQKRLYPEGSMAANLIGFVGKDEGGGDVGYFGLEGFYDVSLSGKGGYVRAERDLKGNPIPFGSFSEILALPGLNLLTTIDRTVQYIIEKKLEEGIEKYNAVSGSVIVMKPAGEILGMASHPHYDPASYKTADPALFKNPVVSDSFEPGSIFKILVMAGALNSGAVEPDTKCDTCGGPITIGKYTIKTWNDKYYKDTTMKETIVHSDNTGMVFAARKLGRDKLFEYLDRFGIGKLTGIDLQGEGSPTLRGKDEWGEVDLATASFGQGIAITPIQFIRATAALANDGILPSPHVVSKFVSGEWEEKITPRRGERVISEETAAKIREMMVAAVEGGEAKWAKPVGFRVAGKTGTAQIPVAGHYDPEKTVASFVGWASADKPSFVMLVTLREPSSSPWGSETAAPLWFSIAKDLFPYFGIQPSQ